MGWYDRGYSGYGFRPYVSVAKRRELAKKEMAKLAKKGYVAQPVAIEGKKITATFWGNAWCENLEAYSDYANRLPRGRTYVRNGSVVDLQVQPGKITAQVMGSELYKVTIAIKPLGQPTWGGVKTRCAGQIGSLVELLQGKLSKSVMEVVTGRDEGLFPKPREIEMDCSCPDSAGMCKHIAAVMYGIGARLDNQPDLLFKLRQVDHLELIAAAGTAEALPGATGKGKRRATIAAEALGDVFGIELDPMPPEAAAERTPAVAVRAKKGAKLKVFTKAIRPVEENRAKGCRKPSAT